MDNKIDPRIAALQGGLVVTSQNAVVDAEAVSMRYGKVKILRKKLAYDKIRCALLGIDYEEGTWECAWEKNGKLHYNDKFPDLYYPDGKLPEREVETVNVKVRIRPFIGVTSRYQLFAYEKQIDVLEKNGNTAEWNGPEQEIEIKVYKTKED